MRRAAPPHEKGSVRRAWRDAAMSAAALALILTVLVSFDPRVREQAEQRLSSPTVAFSDARHGIKSVMDAVLDTVREQRLDHTSLVVFVFVAGVLLLFMLRT